MLDSEVIEGDLESMKGYLTKFCLKSRDVRAKENQKISLSCVGLLDFSKSREFFGLSGDYWHVTRQAVFSGCRLLLASGCLPFIIFFEGSWALIWRQKKT